MRVLHCADIHLGSELKAKFSKEKSEERKKEIRDTFKRMVQYASDDGIENILLSGDIFDKDKPNKKDEDFFYGVIKEYKDIKFYYLKGNHDSRQERNEIPSNLFLFNEKWKEYDLGENVKLYGIEIDDENKESLYSTFNASKDNINIVMLHGQIVENSKPDGYLINLKELKNKCIDYLALGHIHKIEYSKFDERGIYCYPGVLEPRGFDESGDHGFFIYDTDLKNTSFINFSKRKVIFKDLDISNINNDYEIATLINNTFKDDPNNIYRINLKGEVDAEISINTQNIEEYINKDKFYFANVKDLTEIKLDIEKFKNDKSLKGTFINKVYNDKTISEEDKKYMLKYGINALSNREIDK